MKNLDFDNLMYNDCCFEGQISINFFGNNKNIDLIINAENEEIADIQYQTYEKFKEKWEEIQRGVAESIIKYYNEEEKGTYGPDNKEEFSKWWPDINEINELLEQIELETIIIPETCIMEDVVNGRCLYLLFSKKWGNDTEDNGIGVQIVNEVVSEVGFKEIAF